MHRHSHHKGNWGGRRGRMFEAMAEHMPELKERLQAFAEQMEAGRFGRGRHGAGPDEDGEGGHGGMGFGRGWGGPRGGRMLGHGDLRVLLLALIGEKPRHGYDLIKAVEERFAGAYAPSPGAVYPTLTMLEEQDLIRAEASEGSKKLFAITEQGTQFLKDNEAQVEGMFARIDMAASHYSSRTAPEEVWEAWKTLKQAMNLPRGPWTKEEAERVSAILARAARDIIGK